jgi:hypothetical protein
MSAFYKLQPMRLLFYIAACALCTPLSAQTNSIQYNNKTLNQLALNLYADPAYTPNKYAQLTAAMRKAKQQTAAFFGEQRAPDPDVIFCKKQDCARYFSGNAMRGKALKPGSAGSGGQYIAQQPTIVIVTQGRYAALQLTHELNHVEVHARSGNKSLPSWFLEGLATYVSGQPNCTQGTKRTPTTSDNTHHLAEMEKTKTPWVAYTNDPTKSHASYCQAASEVEQWIKRNGKPALIKLLDRIKAGESFAVSYGPMLTQ